MFNVSEESLNQMLNAIEKEQTQESQGLYLFGEGGRWRFKVCRNEIILVSASTGVGKTSFILDCIKRRIQEKKGCLLISNEEGKVTLYRRLVNAYRKSGAVNEIGGRVLLKEIMSHLLIVDVSDDSRVYSYDRIVDMTAKLIEKHNPDIVFIDQISYCNEKHDKSAQDVAQYDALPIITHGFMKLRNMAHDGLPPIILTQQGQSTSKSGSSEEALRGSKTTPQAVNKHLHLLKGKDMEIEFQVRKYRGSRRPSTAVFEYDTWNETFVPLEVTDEPDSRKEDTDANALVNDAEGLSA